MRPMTNSRLLKPPEGRYSSPPVSDPRKTALVVEDDPEIRLLISTYLQRLGYEVGTASNGSQAIAKLGQARPTILCIDQMLPEATGYDVCEHVRKTPSLKALPILMISARDMPADRATAEELGVRKYLVKPFTQAQFIESVNATLAASGEESQV